MGPKVTLDHCVMHVSDWERSNAFYARVLGAEVVARGNGLCLSLRRRAAQSAWPGVEAVPVARVPVQPGNSDLCFEWQGPIADAVAHLARCGVAIELGPIERAGRQRRRDQRLFPRSRRLAAGIHFLRWE